MPFASLDLRAARKFKVCRSLRLPSRRYSHKLMYWIQSEKTGADHDETAPIYEQQAGAGRGAAENHWRMESLYRRIDPTAELGDPNRWHCTAGTSRHVMRVLQRSMRRSPSCIGNFPAPLLYAKAQASSSRVR